MKKLFILFIAAIASIGTMSAEVHSGICGTDLTWSLNTEDSILTIEGTGAMESWIYAGAPWHSFHSNIVKVVLPVGLTSIGDFAFYECENLVSVNIPNTVQSIGFYGFALCSSLPSIEISDGLTSIGEIAFEGCESLKSVVLGNNITTIGKEAFCTCRRLTNITIPEGVTVIEEMVFAGCPELTSVTIPSTVNTIKAQAFSGCTSLFLEVPDNVSTIGDDAFSSVPNIVCHGHDESSTWGAKCRNGLIDGFVVYTDETKTTVAACSAAIKTGVALANSVTTINPFAFSECFNLTSINLPEGLTTIGMYAFNECRGISSLVVPSSVTSVGDFAFVNVANVVYSGSLDTHYWGAKYMNGYVDGYFIYTDDTKTTLAVCSNAARGSITVPNTVTTLNANAFIWCTNITSVTFPETVITYGDNLFGACSSLEAVNLPSNISAITEYMFNGSGLKHIDIPESVTSIGVYAFGWCDKLRSITLPNNSGLTIHDNAFASCTHLQKIISNAINPPTIEAEGEVFYGVDKTSCILYVPQESIELYQMAPEWGGFNIQAIQNEEPAPCILASGTCGDNLTWELSCEGVLTIEGTGAMYDYLDWNSPWREYKDNIKSVIVEEGVSTIGYAAFRDHGHLQQCSLPSTITSIGEEAFCFCFQLMSIEIPDACTSVGSASFNLVPNVVISDESILPYNGSARSVNGFVEGYFVYADATKHSLRACSSAASGEIALDDAIERIEYMAFAQCEEITNLQFGSHLQYIGEWSLNGCIGLEGLRFQEGLKEIASNAFGNCFGLQYVYLPNSLTTLGDFAIGNCPVLRTIHLGDSLRNVGSQIFDSCQGIDTIYATMTTPPVLDNTAFAASNLPGITCYVPKASLSLYQQAPVWSSMNLKATGSFDPEPCLFASGTCGDNLTWELSCDRVLTISGTGEMADYTWNTIPWKDYSIDSLVIEEGVTRIGNNAFEDCGIKSVILPNSVLSIGDCAFLSCYNLADITVGEQLQKIGKNAFYKVNSSQVHWNAIACTDVPSSGIFAYMATGVSNIIFGDKVRVIPNNFMRRAGKNITELIIPENVEEIGDSAFCSCSEKLLAIYNYADSPQAINSPVFDGVNKTSCSLYVPGPSLDLYRAADGWKDFTNILPIPGTEVSCESDNTIRTISACSGYWFNDEWLEQSGIYHDTLLNHLGCDSIIELHLTIHSSYGGGVPSDLIDTITIVKGDPVIISNGITIYPTETGYQNDTLRTIYGCDSIVTHYIIVTEPKFSVIFLDYNSNVLSEQKVENGKAAQAPQVPTREGYTFVGWNVDIEHIVAPTYAIAIYDKIGGTLTYLSEEGDVIATENVDLHLPAAPIIAGKSFKGWLTESADSENGIVFRATYTFDNPTTHDDVTITPSSNSAYVIFPFITGALTYQLVIRDLFGNVVCKIMFSATGHLLGIAFAPSRNRESQQATQTTGFNFTVEGLDANTTYEYEFVANDDTDEVIETLSGSFTTTAEVPTDNEQVNSPSAVRKYLDDGHLMIDANSHIFNTQGKMIK